MFAASAFGVTPASRRWSRSSVLNQFRLNFLFFAGLLLASASAAMIYTRIFGEGHLGASIVHGLVIGGVGFACRRGLFLPSSRSPPPGFSTTAFLTRSRWALIAGVSL